MATKIEFISNIVNNLNEILNDSKLMNYLAQIRAKSIGATFNSTFNEEIVWKDASYLATYGAVLLNDGNESEQSLGMISLKRAAEIFEYLSKISENFDKEYLSILSALCYDISGFQANAFSMASSFRDYKLNTEVSELSLLSISNKDILETNFVLEQSLLILQKRIPLAHKVLKDRSVKTLFREKLFIFLDSFYRSALKGEQCDLTKLGQDVYHASFKTNNHILNLFSLLLHVRVNQFLGRSIWQFVDRADVEHDYLWRRYSKIVANSYYKNSRVNKVEDRISRYELWNSQLQALKRGVVNDTDSYVIQMPTSAGKTMIAEMAILNSWGKEFNPNAKILYIAPFRALVNQVESELSSSLGKLRISVSSLAGSYEYDIFDELLIEESNILVVTPEKADMLLRTNIEFYQNLKLLVVDEGHVVGEDSSRGHLFELLIAKIRMLQPELKTLFISAVLEKTNAEQLSRWLTSGNHNLLTSPLDCEGEEWKPTRKIIGRFNWENQGGRITYQNVLVSSPKSKNPLNAFVHNIITQWKLTYKHPETKRNRTLKFPEKLDNKSQSTALLGYQLSEKGPTLIFCSRPDWAIGVGKSFLKLFDFLDISGDTIPHRFSMGRDSESYRIACEWYGEDHEISKCLFLGIGLHFGKLVKSLRQTIEREYKSGILNILISTNTIGQGLNFPIKNLIFHSVEINPQQENYHAISVRDFWNVLGRAGRAGKETEGHVIFMTLNAKDQFLFSKYIDESNLEPVESYFYTQLKKLYNQRISEDFFVQNIGQASESTILQLLCEEAIDISIENLSTELASKSLYKVQVDENSDLAELSDKVELVFNSKATEIVNDVVEEEKRILFAKTGLNIQLCHYLYNLIQSNSDNIKQSFVGADVENIKQIILNMLVDIDYTLIGHEDMNFLKDYQREHVISIFNSWVNGVGIKDLKNYWESNIDEEIKKLNFLIAEGFEYLFPWISSSILEFMIKLSEVEKEDLDDLFLAIPTFIKYGTADKNSCYLLAVGMRSRELAVSIVSSYTFSNTKALASWLTSVTQNELRNDGFDNFSIREIFQLSEKYGAKSFDSFMTDEVNIKVFVSGIKFEESRKQLSKKINRDLYLTLERDYENQFDNNAIFIKYENEVLGYVPREEARFLAPFIDIDEEDFSCLVVNVQSTENDWNKIEVLITKIPF